MEGAHRGLCTLAVLVALSARAGEPRLATPRLHALLATREALATPASAAICKAHFADSRIAVAGLPFDLTCHHVPPEDCEDPSACPDVFIGLRRDRIVAALVTDATRVPRSRACSHLPDLGGRLCTSQDVTGSVRRDWAQRWSAVLRSAG